MNTDKLQTWYEISNLLKETKAREAELRRELCEEIIAGAAMTDGRVTIKGQANHLAYKAVQALSHRVDDPVLRSMWDDFNDAEKAAFTFKPSLKLREYKALPEDSIAHEAIVTTLAMPVLSVDYITGGE